MHLKFRIIRGPFPRTGRAAKVCTAKARWQAAYLLLIIPNVVGAHTHGHVFVIQLLLLQQAALLLIRPQQSRRQVGSQACSIAMLSMLFVCL